jgi:hypothetical protein
MTMSGDLPRGVVPRGTYAKGGRSPIVYVMLCAPCAGYAPLTGEDYSGFLCGHCQGCGTWSREVHRFQALIMSAANGGCMCTTEHQQVTGDLPTETSALAVWTEVKTRPAETAAPATGPPQPVCPGCGSRHVEHERGLLFCRDVRGDY